jgi:copper(I)-binding protein
MRSFIRQAFSAVAVLSLAFAGLAAAHDYQAGTIKVDHPWTRATAPGAQVGVGYMKITNNGAAPVQLIGASTPAAARVEVHTMSMDGGVMRMRAVPSLTIPARGTVELKSGGLHLMLIGLKKPLVVEDLVPLTLNFSGGITLNVELYVEQMGASGGHGH